ncbi:hypothetical protein HY969_01065 [Candidatus Kaiserbacteria bacterium]|nr:hypothetical protein [Candidatus Kaiserbacteria bacterium]
MNGEEIPLLRLPESAKLFEEIQIQFTRQKQGHEPWPIEKQRSTVGLFLQGFKAGFSIIGGDKDEILRVVFPLTPEGALASLQEDIKWETSTTGKSEAIAELLELTKGIEASEHCIRLRAPGGEIIPLSPDKAAIRWETIVEDWLQKARDPDPVAQMIYLGQRIAGAYKLQKHHVMQDVGEADQYITTYHYEALVRGHEHDAHCCGAHGNDTARAMMSALAQAALIAWATDGKKNVLVKGRRTSTATDKPRLITPPQRYDRFLKDHFSKGEIVPDPEKKLQASGSLYLGEKRPALQDVHAAILRFNKALPKPEKPDEEMKKVLISCADDRVGVRIDEKGGIHVSNVPQHISNTMHVSIGERANKILNNKVEPPVVYRSTLVAGITNISEGDLPFIHQQIVHDVPLIVKQVMSREDRTKQIYIDAVVGAEPHDMIEPEHPEPVKRFHPDTVKILTNEDILIQAGIDSSIIKGIVEDPNEVVSLTAEERRECIRLHEVKVFRGLDKIVVDERGLLPALKAETEREFRDDRLRFGQPRNLRLYLRLIRAAKGTVESRRLIVHSGA